MRKLTWPVLVYCLLALTLIGGCCGGPRCRVTNKVEEVRK